MSRPSQQQLEYRGFFFTNFYMSSLQHGLQTAHCVAEMFSQLLNWHKFYEEEEDHIVYRQLAKLNDWAINHKTIIILDGGNHSDLQDLHIKLKALGHELELPMAAFNEDLMSLNRAMTCVGIIVPNHIYNIDLVDPYDDKGAPIPETELQLKHLLSSYKLAK